VRQLTSELAFPIWSPTSSELALLWVHEHQRIWILDATGANRRLLFQSPLPISLPIWSPDGQSLAVSVFSRSHWGAGYEDFDRLYLLDASGANPRLVFQDTWGAQQETWSSDSQRLAFLDHPVKMDQEPGLYMLSRGGIAPHRLAEIQIDGRFVWSPDSQKIAFMQHAPDDGTYHDFALNVVDVESQQVRLLAKDINIGGVLRPDWPTWAPDSRQIAYTSNAESEQGNSHLYMIDVDGTNRRCLTKETLDHLSISHLAWQP
jgi:Tol biopolymer transport system component